jgi:hypothetical protein
VLESRCVVKRDGGRGNGGDGNGHGVPVGPPRARAKYLTDSSPANDGDELVVLTAAELVALVRNAVDIALDERDARARGSL